MKDPIQMEMESDRKMGATPAIGTEIFDPKMPSELNFKPQNNLNPQDDGPSSKEEVYNIKQYIVRGKGIFQMESKYKEGYLFPEKLKRFPVKAFNDVGNKGLMILWETMVGYSKKELIIQDGQVYVTVRAKNENVLQSCFKLGNLMKIFVDLEDKTLRLVFKQEQNKSKRVTKDYQLEDPQPLLDKILLECNIIGLTVIQDEI